MKNTATRKNTDKSKEEEKTRNGKLAKELANKELIFFILSKNGLISVRAWRQLWTTEEKRKRKNLAYFRAISSGSGGLSAGRYFPQEKFACLPGEAPARVLQSRYLRTVKFGFMALARAKKIYKYGSFLERA